jgi:ABC-type multidrug transport system ATPase subunit
MKIKLHQVSKKFGTQQILKDVSAEFVSGKKYAITGPNGSGKSTLLRIISGMLTPNVGIVSYTENELEILPEDFFRHISYCAPYLDLPEELTLAELLFFHESLKPFYQFSKQEIIALLEINPDKEIRNLSSGMKQRVKLALAFFTQSKVLLLDEPTANFDDRWKAWYLSLVKNDLQNRIVIICSNEKEEYDFAEEMLAITI